MTFYLEEANILAFIRKSQNIADETQDILKEYVEDDDDNNNEVVHISCQDFWLLAFLEKSQIIVFFK